MTFTLVALGGAVLQESRQSLGFHNCPPLMLAALLGRVPQEGIVCPWNGPALSLVSSQGVGT